MESFPDTSIIIYSNRKFIYDLLSQYTEYKLASVLCLSQLADLSSYNNILILDQPNNQVNYEIIHKLYKNFTDIITIISQDDIKFYKRNLFVPVTYLIQPLRLSKLLTVIGSSVIRGAGTKLNDQYLFCYEDKIIIKKHPLTGEKLGKIDLTEKEAELLNELCKAKGNVVDKAHILKSVWGYLSPLDTHTLETHIYRLRQKLDAAPELVFSRDCGYGLKTNDSI